MNSLKIFESSEFGSIRTVEIDNEVWFVGKDVAEILGYTNPRKAIGDHVDEEDKGVTKCDTPGGAQNFTIINESGLYSLVLSSKLPTAKQFKRWVTKEVIPSIRKHGGYIVGQEGLNDDELLSKALMVAQNKIAEREKRIAGLEVTNSALIVANEVMKPKADYFDELVDKNLLTGFRETAKQLGIKERAFINFLIDKKYIYRDKRSKLQPYAQHVKAGLFELKECHNDKTLWAGTQTLITPKGRETFRLLYIPGVVTQ